MMTFAAEQDLYLHMEMWVPHVIFCVAALGFLVGAYIVFRIAFQDRRGWPLIVAAAAWGLFGFYEFLIEVALDPQKKFNIRVDLLVLWPAMAVGTLACFLVSFIKLR